MPIRLLHFADLHLGVETHGQYRPEKGYSSRIDDFLAAFDQVIDAALRERVDAVLFAGDAFKNANPSATIQREFAARIQKLLAASIPTVLLVGNHDQPRSPFRSTPVDIYAALQLPGIIVVNRPRSVQIETPSGPLQVVALPWISPHLLLAGAGEGVLSAAEMERRYKETVSALVRDHLVHLNPNIPAVFLGHLTLEGARFGSERSTLLGSDPLFSLEDLGLDHAPIDYVALGHLHSYQELHHRPLVVYAGSIERIDFGEEREEKGYVLVSIADGPYPRAVEWQFYPVRTRPLLTLRVQLRSADPMNKLGNALAKQRDQVQGAIVRLFIAVSPEQATAIRPTEIRRWLLELGAAHVAGVTLETERIARPRVTLSHQSRHDPVTLLAQWLALRAVPEDLAQDILARGRNIIARVDSGDLQEHSAEPR